MKEATGAPLLSTETSPDALPTIDRGLSPCAYAAILLIELPSGCVVCNASCPCTENVHSDPSFPPIKAVDPVESRARDLLPLLIAETESEKLNEESVSGVAQSAGIGRLRRVLESLSSR